VISAKSAYQKANVPASIVSVRCDAVVRPESGVDRTSPRKRESDVNNPRRKSQHVRFEPGGSGTTARKLRRYDIMSLRL
jgi:hypothetical protein